MHAVFLCNADLEKIITNVLLRATSFGPTVRDQFLKDEFAKGSLLICQN